MPRKSAESDFGLAAPHTHCANLKRLTINVELLETRTDGPSERWATESEFARFANDVPEHYDHGLGPHIFVDFARDLAARAAAENPRGFRRRYGSGSGSDYAGH